MKNFILNHMAIMHGSDLQFVQGALMKYDKLRLKLLLPVYIINWRCINKLWLHMALNNWLLKQANWHIIRTRGLLVNNSFFGPEKFRSKVTKGENIKWWKDKTTCTPPGLLLQTWDFFLSQALSTGTWLKFKLEKLTIIMGDFCLLI